MFGVQSIYQDHRLISYVHLQTAFLILITYNWMLISALNIKKLNGGNTEYLSSISPEDWKSDLDFGIEFINRQVRLEENLVKSRVFVENGSISHVQLLDALPNEEARRDNDIARKLLAASLYVFNSRCAPHGIEGEDCENFLAMKSLPANSELLNECLRIIESRRNGHNSFRRLLSRFYKDGIYEMFSDNQLISPLLVSKQLHSLSLNTKTRDLEDVEKNLAVIQWAQFIEHDLSKPVVTSMRDGSHIECCNKDSFELGPRHRHPSCVPLILNSGESTYDKVNCLNYVRSAVAVSTKCTFGAVDQLNQASSHLDLSQLYGFTDEAQRHMRYFHKGQIKSSANDDGSAIYTDQLPKITSNLGNFCAFKNYSHQPGQCFMAGDSRVNSSPLTISIYTIFMRNHNQIAKKLSSRHPLWSDEVLFQTAKTLNTQIYRKIVFDEWLPIVLGEDAIVKIKQGSHSKDPEDERISNEFAIAAMRFYLSMLPNALNNFTKAKRLQYTTSDYLSNTNSNILPSENIISLIDQTYKPDLGYTSKKIDSIFESIFNQPAMKLDTIYEDSLILDNLNTNRRPTHSDLLAYDIQRGRDHGLKSYINYIELYTGQKIGSWTDLDRFIAIDDLNKLKSIYNDVNKVDLLVGGMAEINSFGALVGPTFKYILGEQFSRIYQRQLRLSDQMLPEFEGVTVVDLLCANTELQQVPRSVFLLISDKNPLLPCNDYLKLLRP
ncbi:peroxidase isoform X1 [Anastrepha obliqua]|uniref:peroxidase isoform X1 n=1 Tax=Anastrepha obliqua TaxID=95512 RepID=UPI002409F8B2|nr:peroxidase isoform X1 [Anastrepha obliqua]XP_054735546.1 peroxidase isoform X1 [Anastrepha obliqua]